MDIKPLDTISFDQLYNAFSAAFADYEIQLSYEQLNTMLQRRGFEPKLSFGAFDNGELVSFTCNGFGQYNGLRTVYDTGTGTLKEYRGQGLAGKIFEYSVSFLREAEVKQYLLEVLKHNEAAVSVYRKQGFKVSREFSYFTETKETIINTTQNKMCNIRIEKSDLQTVKHFSSWFDFQPSWQNSYESIHRQRQGFVVNAAIADSIPVGYCILEAISGDIAQIAVNPEYRRRGIASALLAATLKECTGTGVKLINTDNQFPTINEWANSVGLVKRGEQFEMILEL
ncbi:MAG: acetyltransferase [Bacteroidetes bacterium]|nr:acetyltransferase [Bacteroidota bacterium]